MAGKPLDRQSGGMSDKPESMIVRMLRWIDAGLSRLIERAARTEQEVVVTQLSMKRVVATLERIEARLDQIERRLPPGSQEPRSSTGP